MRGARTIGFRRSIRFAWGEFIRALFILCFLPPLRAFLLRMLGAKIGKGTVIQRFEFINFYRGSFGNLRMGRNCFVGDGSLLDLADVIEMEDNVSLAQRVTVLTHQNIGYADHPLQRFVPSKQAPTHLHRGSFVGANSTLLCGVKVGPESAVAAGAVVTKDVPPGVLVGGVPARMLKELGKDQGEA